MAEPTIIRGSEHMFSTTYEGNGKGQRVGNFVPFTDNGTIAKSVMVDHGSSSYLERTQDTVSGDDNKRKATFSCWFKTSGVRFGNETALFCAAPSGRLFARFDTSNRLVFRLTNSTTEYQIVTNRTFEDTTKFYHLLWQVDASQSTASNRSRVWIDGSEITSWASAAYPAQNTDVVGLADGTVFRISSLSHSELQFFDGYIAEFNCISGSIVDVSTFGLTDTSTGRWIPKTLTGITYGTNGFRCEFANSAGQTIGDDTSGNGNDLTLNGIGVDHITTDSPTQNYSTFEDAHGGTTKSEGSLKIVIGNSNFGHNCSSLRPRSGKWYGEFKCVTKGRSEVGIQHTEFMPENSATARLTAPTDGSLAGLMWYANDGKLLKDSSNNNDVTLNTYDDDDIIGIALDLDTPKVSFFKNGSAETNGTDIGLPNGNYCMVAGDGATGYGGAWIANFGQNPSFSGTITAAANTDGSGSLFKYTPPTGFKGLMQDNLPTTEKGTPDLVWIKNRDAADSNSLYDSTRGQHKLLKSDTTSAEDTKTNGLQKFLKGGAQIEDHVAVNSLGESYVAWNWVANGGTTSANTDGSGASIASTIQANQTAGFSIVQWTGTGSAGTIAHGLSKAPEWIIMKNLETATDWPVYHHKNTSAPETDYLSLYQANATTDLDIWNDTAPTNKVITIKGNYNSNGNDSKKMIFYCWHGIEGYSKFGVYTGTGNADGRYVYTGFKPAWLMIKASSTSNSWKIIDNTRFKFNPINNILNADQNSAESNQSINIDFLSNGFKVRTSGTYINETNQNGNPYVYMAFAEHPFVGNGTNPVTAR